MGGKIKSLSIRIDEDMLNKLHVVADYEGRSANSQILILIRDAIEKYEDKNGKIEFWLRDTSVSLFFIFINNIAYINSIRIYV